VPAEAGAPAEPEWQPPPHVIARDAAAVAARKRARRAWLTQHAGFVSTNNDGVCLRRGCKRFGTIGPCHTKIRVYCASCWQAAADELEADAFLGSAEAEAAADVASWLPHTTRRIKGLDV
jgi:hypothetical protein